MDFETEKHADDRRREYLRKSFFKLHLLMILGMLLYILGGGSIYGYAADALVLIIAFREDIPFREAVGFRRKMTVPTFVILLILSLMIHPLIVISGGILTPLFASFGLHIDTIKDFWLGLDNGYEPTPLPNVIMAGLLVPLFEETICRGYIAGVYHRVTGSKMHAIIFSGIIFGAMHCDIESFVPFTVGGIIFAYVAFEYGIVWSAVYHGFTNLVVGELIGQRVFINLQPDTRYPIYCAVSAFIAVICIIIMIVKRREIMDYISENACEREDAKLTVTSLPFIFFCGDDAHSYDHKGEGRLRFRENSL